jgi:hypothetical protein
MPTVVDDAILLFASYKLFLGVRDAGSANLMLQDYLQEINTLRFTMLYEDENTRMTYERYGMTTREDVLDFK